MVKKEPGPRPRRGGSARSANPPKSGKAKTSKQDAAGTSPRPGNRAAVTGQSGGTRGATQSRASRQRPLPAGSPSEAKERLEPRADASPRLDLGANGNDLPLHQRLCQRLREARRKLGWTLDQASRSSDVSRSMISQIERGLANPTLAVAYRLASAYGLSLGELVDPPGKQPRINVVRSEDRAALFRDDGSCRVRTLSPLSLEKDVEFYEVSIHPGQRMSSSPHFRETREFVTVESGSLVLRSGDEEVRLEQGDSAQYPADVAHELINPGPNPTMAFLVVIYPTS